MAVVISPNLVGGEQDVLSACQAIIGYHNYLFRDSAVVTASSEAVGFPASAVKTPMTYERWLATGGAPWLHIDLGAQLDVDYVGIGVHTLQDGNVVATVESSADDSTWEPRGVMATTTSSAIMLLMRKTTARYWRITLSDPAEIGVVYIGLMLKMPVRMYGGHSPITLSRQNEIMPNRSVTGQFLGRSVIRQGYATSYTWQNMPANWYRDQFDPFVEHAVRLPFFIAWNPLRFPDEAAYSWVIGDISPVNMGVRDLMQVSMDVEAIA